MTNSDIIKALEYFTNNACEKCKVKSIDVCAYCVGKLWADAINAIQRKQAEIERLKIENAELEAEAEKQYEQARADILGNMADGGASCHWCIAEHKKNAIKDFAERLKKKAYRPCDWWPILYVVDAKDIDIVVENLCEVQQMPCAGQTDCDRADQTIPGR